MKLKYSSSPGLEFSIKDFSLLYYFVVYKLSIGSFYHIWLLEIMVLG